MNVVAFQPPVQQIPVVACAEALAQWISRMSLRRVAVNTIKAYSCDVIDAIKHFAKRDVHVVAVIGEAEVESWIDDLCVRSLNPRSRARKLAALRQFLKFALQNRWCTSNAANECRVPFKARRVTAPEAPVLMRVLDAIPKRDAATIRDVRDFAMLRLAFDAALRAGGLASLNLPGQGSDATIDFVRRSVRVAQKGGGITDPIAIDATTVAAVNAWLAVREQMAKPGEPALFVSSRGARIDRRTLHAIAKKRGAAAGVKGLHIHLFRHRRLGGLVETLGVKIARDHAQHASETTTMSVYGAHAGCVSRKLIRDLASLDAMQGRAA